MKTAVRFLLAWAIGVSSQLASAQVRDTAFHSLPHSSYAVFRGRVDLPTNGIWDVRTASDEAIVQLYRLPPQQVERRQLGRRMQVALEQQRNERSQWKIRSLYSPCVNYAREHDGVGPQSPDQIGDSRYRQWVENLDRSPWPDVVDADGEQIKGPFTFLVPQAQFHFTDHVRRSVDPRSILAIELRPYLNDGRHWVLYTDGICQREPWNQDLLAEHGLEVRPVFEPSDLKEQPPTDTVAYTLIAVRRDRQPTAFDVVLLNSITGEEQTQRWDPTDARDDPQVLKTLSEARQLAWQPYLRTGPTPVLRSWQVFELGEQPPTERQARPGDQLSMFAVLGGRAAVEETLQLQVLQASTKKEDPETVAVSSLPGVKVKAHPFEQMLAGQPGGQLQLAETVPLDRFFVYLAQPDAILPFLDHGAGFLAGTGAMVNGNRLDYDLTERYLDRLAISRAQLEAVLRSGLVKDLALSLPDLFLIDGTDLTVVARLAQPQLVGGLLQLLGAGSLTDSSILTMKTADGGAAYWALRGELLCLSSNRSELQHVLQQIDDGGQGSLGRSAEFRYMLTQLPVTDMTRVYAYFSDPFIRRLVGPQVKLSQARRMKAQAAMEYLTAQMLRARLDGVTINSPFDLQQAGYVPEGFPIEEFSLNPQSQIQSDVYGSLARVNTLPDVPLDRVTRKEAEAYEQYVDEYERYWRQFFDPIAMRLADTPQGTLELSTFILPLIDSSVYDRLRNTILHAEDRRPLLVPQLEPAPILQFSANLNDDAWQQITRNFSSFFSRYAQVSPALLDDLGPGLHLALHDADPIIALGSGDLMGAFGSNILRSRGTEMVMIPVMLSILTRPCTVMIETQDTARTAEFLRQAAAGWRPPERLVGQEFRISFYQVEDRDAWVWTMDIVGIIKLRFGLEVIDQFLVLRNIPWSAEDRVIATQPSEQNDAELTLTPAACRLQLPGLFATAADQERRAVMSGLGRLYPFLITGAEDTATAAQRHRQLFGFRPIAPDGDTWQWQDADLASSIYGSPQRQRQPAYDPERPFGLLHGVQQMRLNMQLEDAGLRSTVVWKFDP